MACNGTPRVDLHVHTTASDGTLTPLQVLELAAKLRLGAVAITDHDTLDGVQAVRGHSCYPEVPFLNGVEISTAPPAGFPHKGSLHILGYGFDTANSALIAALNQAQEARRNRNPQIIQRLNALGLDITLAEVSENTNGDRVGRPHIARVLVAKGMALSIDDAFDRFLGNGQPAYIDKYRIPSLDALNLLQAAGGVAVLAHPGLLAVNAGAEFEQLLIWLKNNGLGGLEVWYPEHTPQQTRTYFQLAQRYDLVATGGTDFHGALKPEVQLGYGAGNFRVPLTAYTELQRRIQMSRPRQTAPAAD